VIGRVLGEWRLEGVRGRGGMGTVYAARHEATGALAALKTLPAGAGGLDAGLAKRFAQEAEVLRRLRHPGIVRLLGGLEQQGEVCYFAMELVRGQDLGAVLRARGRLSGPEAVAVGLSVLGALAAAHAQGVVHRDVKPQNVLLTADGAVKVVDFGLARALDATRLTGTGERLGTPAFMSPEQADGKPAGPPSDVYSAAVLLYTCLRGRPPFEAESPLAVLLQHLQATPPPLAARGLPAGLQGLLRRGMAKRPEDRFPDAGAFAAALRALAIPGAEGPGALRALLGAEETGRFEAGRFTQAAPPTRSRHGPPALRLAWGLLLVAVVAALVWGISRRWREQAPRAAAPRTTSAPGATDAAPLERVVVETASGPVSGVLVSIDGETVTIERPDGVRQRVSRAAVRRIRYLR